MKPFIIGGPVLKTAEMLRDGTRELYFYGVTFGQIGIGVFISKKRSQECPYCAGKREWIGDDGLKYTCNKCI